MTIKKLTTIGFMICALSVALVASGVGEADAAKRIRWKMASWFPSKLTQLGSMGKEMVDRLERVSGGNIKIRFFEPNALIPAKECFDAVAKGSVDACWSTPGY